MDNVYSKGSNVRSVHLEFKKEETLSLFMLNVNQKLHLISG